MKTDTRRSFIRKSAFATAGVTLGAPMYIRGYVQEKPSERINIAVAGVNDRGGFYGGTGHTANFTKIKNSKVVAICDADENIFPKAIKDIELLGGEKPETVVDFRKLLENKDIDAVSIATPDYWHALMTIWACQAGKDVYIEKPVSYNLVEGRKMVESARKYGRIVQAGTQYRSNRLSQKAIQMLINGAIGDIYMGRGTVYRHRPSIGRISDSPVPSGVNWDLYRGPAPMIPFNRNHFHYNWHWYWDTATGEFGNNGVHAMDRVRMAMKINKHPSAISCCGGFYGWDSDQEVPNLQVATFEYDNGKIMELEVRSLFTPDEPVLTFFGTEGYATLGNNFQTFMGPKKEPGINITPNDLEPDPLTDEYTAAGIEYHFVNFLDCVKSRKVQDLKADINEGYMSTAMMHLGNIAFRTGRKLSFNGETEKFVDDAEADSYLVRREYRKPYLLPEEV